MRQQLLQITVVDTRRDGNTAACLRHSPQGIHLEFRDDHVSLAVLEKPTTRQWDGGAVLAANTDDGEFVALGGETSGDYRRPFRLGDAVGQQKDVAAADAGLFEEFFSRFQGQVGAAAGCRHDRRRQCLDLRQDGVAVLGQGGYREGVAGEDDQRSLPFAARLEQVRQFEPGARQAARLDILGIHRGREVEQDHQRRLQSVHRLRLLLPGGAGKRKDG